VCLQTWDGPISGMDLDWTGLDWPVLTFDLQKATIANIPGRDESICFFPPNMLSGTSDEVHQLKTPHYAPIMLHISH